jgi:hypothetical protein
VLRLAGQDPEGLEALNRRRFTLDEFINAGNEQARVEFNKQLMLRVCTLQYQIILEIDLASKLSFG